MIVVGFLALAAFLVVALMVIVVCVALNADLPKRARADRGGGYSPFFRGMG
jgi:hypothetical protein